MTLGGFVCVRNGYLLDYCWELAVKSLLGVCDCVIICDSDSDDGTKEAIDRWIKKDSRILPLNFPWTDPHGDPGWFVTWLNYARQHLRTDWCIYLDADEVLHENSYDSVARHVVDGVPAICKRWNFWKDHKHLVPFGHCLGHEVIRLGPANLWFPTDFPDGRSEEIQVLAKPSDIEIFHYGFLRERGAFFRKSAVTQRIWFDQYDEKLVDAEQYEGNWMESPGIASWANDLVPFDGKHPKLARKWLKDRGYK